MLLWKKLLLLNLLGGGISIPLIHHLAFKETPVELLEIDETISRWTRLLEKVGKGDIGENLSSLFSANLSAFSKSAIENSIKQILMQWAIEIWENPEAYFPFSDRLNKFFFYYHVHRWRAKNDIDELSWDLLKKFFIELFFKDKGWSILSQYGDFRKFVLKEWKEKEKPLHIYEWTLKYSNAKGSGPTKSSKSIYKDESSGSKNSYLFPEIEGSPEYSSFIASLKKSQSPDLSLFKKRLITLTDLKNIDDGYKLGSLLFLIQKNNNLNSSNARPASLVTNSSSSSNVLKEINFSETEKTSKFWWLNPLKWLNSSGSTRENPLHLFLEPEVKENDECIWIPSSIFKDNFINSGGGSVNSHFCLFSARTIKNNGNLEILASREKEGISFYLLNTREIATQQRFIEQDNDKFEGKPIDELSPEIISKLTNFLTSNFEIIFYKYLFSRNNNSNGQSQSQTVSVEPKKWTPFALKLRNNSSSKIGDWDFSNFFNENSELLNASKEYSDALYWATSTKKLQENLVSVYEHAPDKFELGGEISPHLSNNSKGRIKLSSQDGLFSPLPFKRGGDGSSSQAKEEEEKEIVFSEFRENGEPQVSSHTIQRKRNFGFFEIITKSFFQEEEKKLYSLEDKANKLKSVLKKQETIWFQKDQTQETEARLKDAYFKKSFLRSLLDSLSNEEKISTNSLFKLWLQKTLFENSKDATKNTEDQNLSSLLESVIKLIEPSNSQEINAVVQLSTNEESTEEKKSKWKSIIEKVFFLERERGLPKSQVAFFKQRLKRNTESSEGEGLRSRSPNGDGENGGNSIPAKNNWILNNYYLSDSAYSSSSESFTEFLSFLYSLYWLTKDNYSNLPKLINLILKKEKQNKALWLVWQVELNEGDKKKIATNSEKKGEKEKTTYDVLCNHFNKERESHNQNPLLQGETILSKNTSEKQKDYSSSSPALKVQVFLKKECVGENPSKQSRDKKKFKGFSGLFSNSFSTTEILKELKEEIFSKFLENNQPENKNYSDQIKEDQEKSKWAAGRYFEDNMVGKDFENNKDLSEFLQKVSLKQKLLKYLEEGSPISQVIEASGLSKDFDKETITLGELKDLLKKTLDDSSVEVATANSKEESSAKDLFKLWNRFSGFLYSQTSSSHYIFHSKSTNKDYMAFLYQLNPSDFEGEGIKKLKENLSKNTVHTLIALLALNKDIREWIYSSELVKQLNI